MAVQSLGRYMERSGLNQTSLSKTIGRSRQNVWNWLKVGATVELTEIGIRIRSKSGRILHETQVAKS